MKNTAARTAAISIRLEREVLDWFRERASRADAPGHYQSLIKQALREYVARQREREMQTVGRAQELYKRYYASCFWQHDPQLVINRDNIALVIEGLRKYGGREGEQLAAELDR